VSDEPTPPQGDPGATADPGATGPLAGGLAERRQATALKYEPGDSAPRVIASGSGYIAEAIIAAAQQAGIPLRSDPALAQALAALELGSEVPEALYRAVAETLAWAYRLDATATKRLR
jgi:flagellar biosynthesis protein